MPVVILAGDEEFELSRKVEGLTGSLLDPQWLSFNLTRLDDPPVPRIIEASQLLPLGTGKKVVLIERCKLFSRGKSKSQSDDEPSQNDRSSKLMLEEFDQSLAQVCQDTYLIFACPFNFDHTLKISKIASKYANLEIFAKEKYWFGSRNPKLETWCRREANTLGATIDDDAIAYLLDSTDADLRQIAGDITKAAIYCLPDKHITYDVVATLSPHHSHVFALLDYWAYGKPKEALRSLEELLSEQSGLPIIAALHTTLSRWIQLKILAALELASPAPGVKGREMPLSELAKRIAQRLNARPFVLEMDLKRTKALSVERLIAKASQLCKLDSMVKTGQLTDRHALATFLAT